MDSSGEHQYKLEYKYINKLVNVGIKYRSSKVNMKLLVDGQQYSHSNTAKQCYTIITLETRQCYAQITVNLQMNITVHNECILLIS